jgi:hypothetical protein
MRLKLPITYVPVLCNYLMWMSQYLSVPVTEYIRYIITLDYSTNENWLQVGTCTLDAILYDCVKKTRLRLIASL